MTLLTRRRLFVSAAGFLAAPAIVRAPTRAAACHKHYGHNHAEDCQGVSDGQARECGCSEWWISKNRADREAWHMREDARRVARNKSREAPGQETRPSPETPR